MDGDMKPVFYVPPVTDDAKRFRNAVNELGYELFDHENGSELNFNHLVPFVSIQGLIDFQIAFHQRQYAVWCDWEKLKCSHYYKKWAGLILASNYAFYPYDLLLPNCRHFAAKFVNQNDEVFVRPDTNDKIFPGGVVSTRNLATWLIHTPFETPDDDLLCLIGTPAEIEAEYRLWIVNGKVVTGSQYVLRGNLVESPYVPQQAIQLAEAAAAKWSPHPAFVLDIAEEKHGTWGSWCILECGSIHTCGLYAADENVIIDAIAKLVETETK